MKPDTTPTRHETTDIETTTTDTTTARTNSYPPEATCASGSAPDAPPRPSERTATSTTGSAPDSLLTTEPTRPPASTRSPEPSTDDRRTSQRTHTRPTDLSTARSETHPDPCQRDATSGGDSPDTLGTDASTPSTPHDSCRSSTGEPCFDAVPMTGTGIGPRPDTTTFTSDAK
ncbi:hypothetical protein [Halorubrum luteum]